MKKQQDNLSQKEKILKRYSNEVYVLSIFFKQKSFWFVLQCLYNLQKNVPITNEPNACKQLLAIIML